jgi:hypothetical protein
MTTQNTTKNDTQGKAKTGVFPEPRESRETTRAFPSLKTTFPGETGKQLALSPGKGNPILKNRVFPWTGMGRGKEKGANSRPPFPYPTPSHGPRDLA